VGVALVGFAGAWRSFAFARGRNELLGRTSRVIGTASGLAFAGIGLTPWNLAFTAHAACVLVGFGALLAYVGCLTVLLWRNAGSRIVLVANCVYVVVLAAYFALALAGPDFSDETGHAVQVGGQKVVVYASMLHLIVLAAAMRASASAS
jgi:hypothetical protein